MNTASPILDILALLTIVADATDREEADAMASHYWSGPAGSLLSFGEGVTRRVTAVAA